MSDSTRPGELSRAAQNEIHFRVEVLSGIAELKTLIGSHITDDARQFESVHKSIAEVKAQQGTVSSNVGNLEKDKSFVMGSKWAAVAIFGGVITLLTLGVAVAALLK